MKKILIDDYEFWEFKIGDATMVFSSAKCGLDFNKNTDEGRKNLNSLKLWFDLDEVGYLNQVHGDNIHEYDGEIVDGDAIITDDSKVGIGVFTADCVPVLIYDTKNKAMVAVHSGWKSTLLDVVGKSIEKLKESYKSSLEDIYVYVGPHNRVCCYDVGEELVDMFNKEEVYKGEIVIEAGKLNLEKCIRLSLKAKGVPEGNINVMKICTYCNEEYELHSYRKCGNNSGRMFSFIYKK